MGMMRELILANVLGLLTIVIAGVPLIELWDAQGAAVAAVIADFTTAVVYVYLVGRLAKEVRPKFSQTWKSILSGLVAAGAAYALPAGAIPKTITVFVVFCVMALITKAVPPEVFDAIKPRKRGVAA
jgi:Na+-driven multidrug efflux pump